jgi:serine/threonine protein kinase
MVVGSPAYQAPEALDDAYCDDESVEVMPEKEDVWALGVTLFHLLFQRLPFAGDTLFEIVNAIKLEGFKIPEGTDRGIGEVLTGMLARDPRERWGIQDLLAHPIIAGAADRASNLPAVPSPPMREGDVRELKATVCPDTFSLADVVCPLGRRYSFGGMGTRLSTGITRTKSVPPQEMEWDLS